MLIDEFGVPWMSEKPRGQKCEGDALATKKTSAKPVEVARSGTDDVNDFMRKLEHPLKPELEAVRAIILGVSPKIGEGIKWNSPSFRAKEWFATINIRKDAVLVILHLGAKVKDNSTGGLTIDDPARLLEWLAKERAAIKFDNMQAIKSARASFANIVRQWVAGM